MTWVLSGRISARPWTDVCSFWRPSHTSSRSADVASRYTPTWHAWWWFDRGARGEIQSFVIKHGHFDQVELLYVYGTIRVSWEGRCEPRRQSVIAPVKCSEPWRLPVRNRGVALLMTRGSHRWLWQVGHSTPCVNPVTTETTVSCTAGLRCTVPGYFGAGLGGCTWTVDSLASWVEVGRSPSNSFSLAHVPGAPLTFLHMQRQQQSVNCPSTALFYLQPLTYWRNQRPVASLLSPIPLIRDRTWKIYRYKRWCSIFLRLVQPRHGSRPASIVCRSCINLEHGGQSTTVLE